MTEKELDKIHQIWGINGLMFIAAEQIRDGRLTIEEVERKLKGNKN